MTTWLVIDCPYLCWRAHHTLGDLSHKGTRTGVIYGFLRDLIYLKDLYATDKVAFCFDSKTSKRKEIFPGYKANRTKTVSEEEREVGDGVRQSIDKLRRRVLSDIGFRNIYHQEGYEADDCIASFVYTSFEGGQVVLVSADKDLYQLLGGGIAIHNPHPYGERRLITEEAFVSKYGIEPNQWRDAQAIAGCSTDCIPGVPGVGIKTACKFLRGELKQTTKAYENIRRFRETVGRNLKLVTLPFPGVNEFDVYQDEVSVTKWEKALKEFGIKNLRGFR